MKSVLIVCISLNFLLLVLRAAELQDHERYQIALQCIEIVGIDRKIVEKAMAEQIPVDDTKYKEFLACSYKKQGYQNENGDILMENIKKFLKKFYNSSDLQQLDVCSGNGGADHGENAYQALQCVFSRLRNMTVTEQQNGN